MIEVLELGLFHFLRPWWLLLLLVPVVVVALSSKTKSGLDSNWSNFVADHLLKELMVKGGHHHWFNPKNVGLVLLTLCVVLMAGPTWQRHASPFVQDQAVLVIALDLSRTMNQKDIQPTRLERAKQKIADLVALRGDARTGLIAYSGSAHQVVPLSNDSNLIKQFLSSIDSSMMPKSGKLPEAVLPIANRMLNEATSSGTLLVIGDAVAPTSQTAFVEYFGERSHQLIMLGMGLIDSVTTDSSDQLFGEAHLSLKESSLKALASKSGGFYLRNTIDKEDVVRIDKLIKHHLASVADDDRPWKDAGYFLLFPISLIFLLCFRRGWVLNGCIALFFIQSVVVSPPTHANEVLPSTDQTTFVSVDGVLSGRQGKLDIVGVLLRKFMDLWLSPDQQGRYYFEKGDYLIAAQRFDSLEWQGIAYYYAENFSAAAELLGRLESAEGRFNYGNALAQSQRYVAAVDAYSKVLEANPDHRGALNNRNFVQQIIDDINRMSESQQSEQGQASKELVGEPQRGDGADRKDISLNKIEQFTADQILIDEQIHEMWMRQVQADPARFLRAKFQQQYSLQENNDSLQMKNQ